MVIVSFISRCVVLCGLVVGYLSVSHFAVVVVVDILTHAAVALLMCVFLSNLSVLDTVNSRHVT